MNKTKELLKIIGSLLLIIILTFAVGSILAWLGFGPDSNWTGILSVLLSQIIFAVCAYLIIRKKKKTYGPSYIRNKGFESDSWKMIIIGLGTAGFGNLLISQVVKLLGENNLLVNNSIDMVNNALSAQTTIDIILQIVVLVVIAPIVEEFLFRGYVFTETKRMFSLAASVIINGLLFGLFHMNLLQGINTFFLAIVLSLIYYYRANITDNIIVHFTNNAIAVVTSFIPQYASAIGIVLIICIFLGLYLLVKICRESNNEFEYQINREKF